MADKEETSASILGTARKWGESSVPPILLATLIAGQNLRPPRFIPLLFPPAFLFSTYLNINGYVADSAGVTAAWSGIYLLMARRRKQALMSKWGLKGILRGATMGTCLANVVGGGLVYALDRNKSSDRED
ncbi:MAG: hypothetical protein M1823_000612 [Watsoniomyces obsoletus]|nr:MAG: hypothetical protein M1823_000612 [Watsoniomyces obsoletus]